MSNAPKLIAVATLIAAVLIPMGSLPQAQGRNAIPAVSVSPVPETSVRGPGSLTFRRLKDDASPMLERAHASGEILPQLNLVVPASTLHPYLELRLYSVKVTSYSINGSGLETFNTDFERIE